MQALCEGADLRDGNGSHNHLFTGIRNRVHNDNRGNDSADGSRSDRMRCVVFHSEEGNSDQGVEMVQINTKQKSKNHNVEEADKVRSGAVYQAWDK